MQLRTLAVTVATAASTAIAAEQSFRNSQTAPLVAEHPVLGRREVLSCEQTYGNGSVQCGPGESNFCYNPSAGQVSLMFRRDALCCCCRHRCLLWLLYFLLLSIPPHTVSPWVPLTDHEQSCCQTDFGFCGAGTYCAPVAGFCCLDGEDLVTCATKGGFTLPASVLPGAVVPDAASTGGGLIPASTAAGGSLVPETAATPTPAAVPPSDGRNGTAAGGRPPYVQVSSAVGGGGAHLCLGAVAVGSVVLSLLL